MAKQKQREIAAREALIRSMAEAMQACECPPLYGDDGTLRGCKTEYGAWSYPKVMTLEQLKAALLLTQYCGRNMYGHEHRTEPEDSCAGSLQAWNDHWSEPGFVDALTTTQFYFDTPNQCDVILALDLHHALASRGGVPLQESDLKTILKPYLADDKKLELRWESDERQSRDSSGDGSSRSRRNREPSEREPRSPKTCEDYGNKYCPH